MAALQVCTRAESQGETTRHGEAFTYSSGVVLAFKRVTNSDQSSTGESGRKRQRSRISDENEEEKRFWRLIKRKAWINPDCGFESSGDDEGSSALLQDNITFSEVVGKWDPDNSCAPVVDDGDSFYPDEEEFHDTLKYIRSMHSEAETHAICRVVPPRTWRPPCAFKECMEVQKKVFSTKVQWIRQHSVIQKSANAIRHYDAEPGPDFTLQNFKASDSKFKMHYFNSNIKTTDSNDPSVEAIEGEYWRIVEHPKEQIKVLYASMSSDKLASGFSTSISGNGKASIGSYDTSGWNLNNTAHLPGAFGSTELSIPRLHIGMCFSFSPWRIEENLLYSLNYLHCGAPRIWYGVPSNATSRFEDFMMKQAQAQAEPNDPHQMISPSSLKAAGIPVYRLVQRPGDFVITFSNVYYSNISCGFNCAEAVNIAPVDQALQCISKGTIRPAIPSANEESPALGKVKALSGEVVLLSDDEGDELKTEDAAHQGNMECQSTSHRKSDKNKCLSPRDINGSEALSKRDKSPAILLSIDLKNPVVELVDVGKLVQREGWCNKDTILPLGFKSRTRFYNYLDLPHTCYYISEVVDYGKGRPYFRVTMDGHPEEAYIRPSMGKCWEDVQLRVNFAIEEHCHTLPHVQSNAICGLNMFGFMQPSIIKAVEALDPSHYCCNYWTGKSSGSFPATNGHQSIPKTPATNGHQSIPDYSCIYDTLRSFFARGSQKELWALQRIFSTDWKGQDWKDAFQALVDQLESVLERDCNTQL